MPNKNLMFLLQNQKFFFSLSQTFSVYKSPVNCPILLVYKSVILEEPKLYCVYMVIRYSRVVYYWGK